MDEKAERAAFEAWCQSIGFTTWRNTEGEYLSNYGAELWSGWQARAALAAARVAQERERWTEIVMAELDGNGQAEAIVRCVTGQPPETGKEM